MFTAKKENSNVLFENYKLSSHSTSRVSHSLPISSAHLSHQQPRDTFIYNESRFLSKFNQLTWSTLLPSDQVGRLGGVGVGGGEVEGEREGERVEEVTEEGEGTGAFVRDDTFTTFTFDHQNQIHFSSTPLPPSSSKSSPLNLALAIPFTFPTHWLISTSQQLHVLTPTPTSDQPYSIAKSFSISEPFKLHATTSTHALLSFLKDAPSHKHKHLYEYRLIRLEDGQFESETWTSSELIDPGYVWDIDGRLLVACRGSIDSNDPSTPMDITNDADEKDQDGDVEILKADGEIQDHRGLGDDPSIPLYSWSQTPTTISVSIPLPNSSPTSFTALKPHVLFTSTGFTLTPPPPTFPPHELTTWATIDPSECIYSILDGILDIEIQKERESPERWTSLFHNVDWEREEIEDPNERAMRVEQMNQAFKSFESSVSGQSASLGKVARIDEDEEDEGIEDEEEIMNLYFLALSTLKTSKETKNGIRKLDNSLRILSINFQNSFKPSIVLKSGIDGQLFQILKTSSSLSNQIESSSMIRKNELTTDHFATFPALSYVLASKRAPQYTYNTLRFTIIFESGNAFVYYLPPLLDNGDNIQSGKRGKVAEQRVLDVGTGVKGVCWAGKGRLVVLKEETLDVWSGL